MVKPVHPKDCSADELSRVIAILTAICPEPKPKLEDVLTEAARLEFIERVGRRWPLDQLIQIRDQKLRLPVQ